MVSVGSHKPQYCNTFFSPVVAAPELPELLVPLFPALALGLLTPVGDVESDDELFLLSIKNANTPTNKTNNTPITMGMSVNQDLFGLANWTS